MKNELHLQCYLQYNTLYGIQRWFKVNKRHFAFFKLIIMQLCDNTLKNWNSKTN